MRRYYYYVFVSPLCDRVVIISATSLRVVHSAMKSDWNLLGLSSCSMDSRYLGSHEAYVRSRTIVPSDMIMLRFVE